MFRDWSCEFQAWAWSPLGFCWFKSLCVPTVSSWPLREIWLHSLLAMPRLGLGTGHLTGLQQMVLSLLRVFDTSRMVHGWGISIIWELARSQMQTHVNSWVRPDQPWPVGPCFNKPSSRFHRHLRDSRSHIKEQSLRRELGTPPSRCPSLQEMPLLPDKGGMTGSLVSWGDLVLLIAKQGAPRPLFSLRFSLPSSGEIWKLALNPCRTQFSFLKQNKTPCLFAGFVRVLVCACVRVIVCSFSRVWNC